MKPTAKWPRSRISKTCEQFCGPAWKPCGKPTAYAYPAYRSGWMALCKQHVQGHESYAKPIAELKAAGCEMQMPNTRMSEPGDTK